MSGLLFLTYEDFFPIKGSKGPMLGNNLKGLSLVFFYSPSCDHCRNLMPIFKMLPNKIGGCQFAMINISQNRQVVEISRQTVVPISYVPYIVLYVNGKPYIRYDGPHEENEIKRFIFEVANNLQNREKFIQSENKTKQVEKSRNPQYTIGVPLFGDDDDYYLEFDQAYVSIKK